MPELPLIVHYMQRDDFGGGPKAVLNIARTLEGMGRQVIITSGRGKLSELVAKEPGLQLHLLKEVPNVLFPWSVLELTALLAKLKPAVVITHGQWGGYIVGLANIFFGLSMPKIYVCHWCSLYAGTDAYRAARNHFIEEITLKAHDQIVCLSKGNAQKFTRAGMLQDRTRLSVIPNSVVPVSRQDIPSKEAAGGLYFVFMGRLEEQKRPDWLLQAWRIALDKGLKDTRLLVLGDGEWRERLEQQIHEQNIDNSVKLCGYRPDAQHLLQFSAGLLMTSLFEGHANVVLEAMASGVPVVTMATDGVQESLTDGEEGFVVPLGDVDAFAERILKLSHDESLRQTMGAKGRETSKLFSPEIQRESYRQLVNEVLAIKEQASGRMK